MLCFTESAPFTTQEVSITGKGKVCGRLQNIIGPLIQVILADLIGRNVLASRLVDGHANRIDVVDVIEEFQCAKGVTLHLRIVLSGYENSKTVFIDFDSGILRNNTYIDKGLFSSRNIDLKRM
jgi:hypothetical protein